MNPLSILRQFVKGLTAETTPGQVAAGAALGMLAGLLPKATLTGQAAIALMFIFRVNLPLAAVTMFAVMLLNPWLDRITDPLGYALLTWPAMNPLWTALYNTPFIPWTGFNNTVLAGGLITGLLLFLPVYFFARKAAVSFGPGIRSAAAGSRLIGGIRKSWLFDWYFRD